MSRALLSELLLHEAKLGLQEQSFLLPLLLLLLSDARVALPDVLQLTFGVALQALEFLPPLLLFLAGVKFGLVQFVGELERLRLELLLLVCKSLSLIL